MKCGNNRIHYVSQPRRRAGSETQTNPEHTPDEKSSGNPGNSRGDIRGERSVSSHFPKCLENNRRRGKKKARLNT
jgi:hypothetical protein